MTPRRSNDFDWPAPAKSSARMKAEELIRSIQSALKTTHHYDLQGRELTSVRAVLEALKRDGKIELKRKGTE